MSLSKHILKSHGPDAVISPRPYFFQPKLTINNPNDRYEREADTVADTVMRMEPPSAQTKQDTNLFFKPPPITTNSIQRNCAHCEAEEKEMQRKEMNDEETIADNNFESYVGSLSGSGQPLPDEVRNFYEPRFGYDFSTVKVHTDTVASESAQSINALAYTSGNNIVFNNGQYSPDTDNGKRLLGHELTHVVQQSTNIHQKKKNEVALSGDYYSCSFISRVHGNNIQRSKSFSPTNRSDQSLGTLVHSTLLPMIKDSNADLFIEVKIPGGNKTGVSPGSFGIADLYKAIPTQGKSRTIALNFTGDKPSFLTKDTRLDFGGGPYNHNTDSAPQGTTASPRIKAMDKSPNEIEIGDLKPGGSGEVILGGGQVSNYINGIEKTALKANDYLAKNPKETDGSNRWNVFARKMLSLTIPSKLSYPGKGIAKNRLAVYDATGMVVADSGLTGSLFVYKDKHAGIWSYEWIPDKIDSTTGSGKVNEVLNRLNNDVIPPLICAGATGVQPKRIAKSAPVIARKRAFVQRKEEKFNDEGWKKSYYSPWKTDAEKFLGDKNEVQKVEVAETLVDLQDRTGSAVHVPGEVLDRGRGLSKIRHWNRFGGIYGWLREKFDFIFLKVHGFAKKIKDKVAKLVKKASSSSFGNWIKAVAKVIFKIFKMVGAWAVSQILDKLVDSLKEGIFNNLKILINMVMPDSVKSKIEEFEELKDKYQGIIDEQEDALIKRFFGDKLEFFEKLEEFEKIAEFASDIATLVEWGVRLLACLSPPAIGCLWNLAISALQAAFGLLMQTCWFSKEVYAPVISKVDMVRNFPAQVASKIVDVANEYIPVPSGFEKIFAPIIINNSEFRVDCDESGDGSGSLTPERRAILDLVTEVGTAKFNALLELLLKRGAGPWVLMTAERVTILKDLLKEVDIELLQQAAKDKTKGLPVPLEDFLKNIATYSPQEKKLISESDARKAKATADKAKRLAESQGKDKTKKEQAGKDTDEASDQSSNEIVAIPVAAPPPGVPVVEEYQSSPGWISIPYGIILPELSPSKTAYIAGEPLEIKVVFWIDHKWVWFTDISATFDSIGSLNGNRIIDVAVSQNFYFKTSRDATTVYVYAKGMMGIYLDKGGLP